MELRIVQERAFVLHSTMTGEQAHELARAQRVTAFGTLTSLMFRPKEEEVQVTRQELRYEPFWHVAARSELDYEVRETYTLASQHASACQVTLDADPAGPRTVTDGQVTVTGVTRCREQHRREQLVDGVSGEERPTFGPYLRGPMTELTDLARFAPPGAMVVAPEIRASFVVRRQLVALMKAVQADTFHTEVVEVEALGLFFRPVYAIDYAWVTRQRQQSMELDAVTGELRPAAKSAAGQGRALDKDLLFDIGADAVGLVVPGGSLALRVGKLVVQRTRG